MMHSLEDEVIDGYLVPASMKKVWAVQLDLLKQFMSVCEKYGLRYFLSDGNLLGAVRHKGYIPWDDDIDVCMPRPDYNKLMRLGNSVFGYPYFFQSAYTDPDYVRPHAQLRNSNTTGALENEFYTTKINQGIFLDVFPLDGLPSEPALVRKQKNKVRHYIIILGTGYPTCYSLNAFVRFFQKLAKLVLKPYWLFHSKADIYRKMDAAASMYDYDSSEYVKYIGFDTMAGLETLRYRKSLFDDVAMYDYEGISVPGPRDYNTYLIELYGEKYMIPP